MEATSILVTDKLYFNNCLIDSSNKLFSIWFGIVLNCVLVIKLSMYTSVDEKEQCGSSSNTFNPGLMRCFWIFRSQIFTASSE